MTSAQPVAVILTKNEAAHIAGCITSLAPWVNHVIVWDSGSTDGTCTIAQHYGAQIVLRPFDNYAAQRQAALNTIKAKWIFFVDADERATPQLGQEILRTLSLSVDLPDPPPGYWVPRRNFIVGREIRYGGYAPDYQLRLMQPHRACYQLQRAVHEVVELEGEAGYLDQPLLHFNYETWQQFYRKQFAYARYEALILQAQGIRPRPHNFILQPLREGYRRYIKLGGWQDGLAGMRLALLFAFFYGIVPYWTLVRSSLKQTQHGL